MDNANLTAALALAAAGVKIFPAGTDKRPLFKQWQEIATTECEIISEWWRRAPYALPAIPCGANGLLVIDLDRHGNGSDGVSAFEALAARHGVLSPAVPMVKTPNSGLHLYFRQPPGEPLGNGRGSLPAGCDVRGVGGFVIGPGAVLPDGRGWVRVAERPPITHAAQLAWIESILRRPAQPARDDHPAGETSDQRGRGYAEQALREIEAELAITREGERNERLYKAAFRLATMSARGWLMEGEITGALLRACTCASTGTGRRSKQSRAAFATASTCRTTTSRTARTPRRRDPARGCSRNTPSRNSLSRRSRSNGSARPATGTVLIYRS